jgi:hypothetical protein
MRGYVGSAPIGIPTNGLVAYFPFRENALNHGPSGGAFTTITATHDTNGKYGGAYNFTPSQHMKTVSTTAFSLQTLTIGYWYYMDQLVDGKYNNGVASGRIGQAADKYNYQLSVYFTGLVLGASNGSLHNNIINPLTAYGGVSSVFLGKWNYISATISSGVGTLYLNCSEIEQKTLYVPATTSRELVVGYHDTISLSGYTRICEITLYNRVLTPGEMESVAMSTFSKGVMSLDEHYDAKMRGDL